MFNRSVRTAPIPYVHPRVEMAHIQSNGKLLTDQQIEYVKTHLHENGKYSKLQSHANFSMLVFDGKYYAIYFGTKHHEYDQGEDNECGKALGEGQYGKAKLVQDLDTGEWHVLKVQQLAEQIKDEVAMLKKLDRLVKTPLHHQFVILQRKNKKEYILMKRAVGVELFTFQQDNLLRLPTLINIALNAASALKKLFDQDILHRDIKLENMIYDNSTDAIELIDFGFAVALGGKEKYYAEPLGTPEMMAPEIVTNNEYSQKSDIFALGKSLAELFRLSSPFIYDVFTSSSYDYILYRQNSPRYNQNSYIVDPKLREQIWTFLQHMTLVNKAATDYGASERPSIDAVITFFQEISLTLQAKEKSSKIAILDVDDYVHASKDDVLQKKLINMLKKYDEIWLTQTKLHENVKLYSEIKHDLELNYLVVGDYLLHSALRSSCLRMIPDYLAAAFPAKQQKFFHVTCRGEKEMKQSHYHSQSNHARVLQRSGVFATKYVNLVEETSLPIEYRLV